MGSFQSSSSKLHTYLFENKKNICSIGFHKQIEILLCVILSLSHHLEQLVLDCNKKIQHEVFGRAPMKKLALEEILLLDHAEVKNIS